METLFVEVSLAILLATGVALVLYAARQPLILAYILAGVLAGPLGFGLITDQTLVQSLSTFGIAFLLFLVGIELDPARLRNLGRGALLIGLAQIIFTAGLGYIILRAFGIAGLAPWYIALALTFSSTIIVVKLLSERQELDSLNGRLTVSMLLLQDAVAILALILLSSVGTATGLPITALLLAIGKGALLVLAVYLMNRYVLPPLFNSLARSHELLFLSALAWCFLVALASGWIGFSIEIGAFLAGLALASLPYNLEISARIKSLRDFFVTLFFIALGSQLTLSGLGELKPLFWVLTLFVLIGNPLIVLITMGLLGYRKRTSLKVALTVGMISEFSLVLMGLGLKLGHVTPSQMALVTAIGVVTITITTYFISHTETLYRLVSPVLSLFERPGAGSELANLPAKLENHVVLFGYHRLGERIAATLDKLGRKILVVDFNPDIIKRLISEGKSCLYGDMGDIEILEHTNMGQSSLVISTVPDLTNNLLLLQNLQQHDNHIPVYVTATNWHDTRDLYQAGADYVIFPHYLSGEHLGLMLGELALNPDRVRQDRSRHLAELEHHYASRTRH